MGRLETEMDQHALFYHERRGYMGVFRPHAMPNGSWLSNLTEYFTKRSPHANS